ncbi:SDR family oxidoreductase [Nonomuraea zeae]|uniref:SDR family oxidoreductase n=1 Tax=Nonomuraea zeae TaxID=1642303 RepID=A0A5S4FC06_9ACTN|nr:SDR family oxidoreductase [Nonomuraea zeae]TMR15314.1 SDR family oxidoreductase [Nonomuraea zeae]
MRTVLVTGCGSGFGLLTALTLARRGDRVIATVRDPHAEGAQRLRRTAADEGLPLQVTRLDVTEPGVTEALEGTRAIDALVNNAGYILRGPVVTLSDDELRAQFETNVLGPVRLIRALAPHMTPGGVIVNVSSIAGSVGVPFEGAYSASKAALESLSAALRFELRPYGLRVVLVAPGNYSTSIRGRSRQAAAFTRDHRDHEAYERFWAAFDGSLAGRGDPQEVADAIAGAIDDPEAVYRRLVGTDAQFIYRLWHDNSQEDFERLVTDALGLGR